MSLDNKLACHRCGKEPDKKKWNSEWDPCKPDDHHYKSFVCDCGKKNWVRMNFHSSGHDKALEEDPNPIESSVKRVQGSLKESFD